MVDARRFASVDDILARSIERGDPPFIVVLDSLEDPQNVGTLLRSAEGAGVHGVVFPTERQAPLSPAAVKASAGATEHLLLSPVDDLPATLTDLRLRGVRIVGSEAEASLTAREADLRGPIALVVGSEGHGLSPAVRRRCDLFVRLPMRGAIGSLNAAVAGSILLFEILGQRDIGGPATPLDPLSTTKPARKAAETPKAAASIEATEPAATTAHSKRRAVKASVPKAKATNTEAPKARKATPTPKAPKAEAPKAASKPKTAARSKLAKASAPKATATPAPAGASAPKAATTAKPAKTTAPKAAAKPKAATAEAARRRPRRQAAEPKATRRKTGAAPGEAALAADTATPEAGDDLLPP